MVTELRLFVKQGKHCRPHSFIFFFFNKMWTSIFDQHINSYIMCAWIIEVWVYLLASYPDYHRRSRVAPACCSTWPRTHRSWWGWRLRSPRPASPHRRPACASCSVCERRNGIQKCMLPWGGLFGMLITRETNDVYLGTLICLCQLIKGPMKCCYLDAFI